MKTGLTTVFLLALVAAFSTSLSGCGQKGPLYHESPAEVSADEAERQERNEER